MERYFDETVAGVGDAASGEPGRSGRGALPRACANGLRPLPRSPAKCPRGGGRNAAGVRLRLRERVRGAAIPERPNAWLLTIARNECLDRLRRRTRSARESSLDRGPASRRRRGDRGPQRQHRRAAHGSRRASGEPARRDRAPRARRSRLHTGGGDPRRLGRGGRVAALPSARASARARRHPPRSRRAALLPIGLREGLAKAIPGFPAAHSRRGRRRCPGGRLGRKRGGGRRGRGGGRRRRRNGKHERRDPRHDLGQARLASARCEGRGECRGHRRCRLRRRARGGERAFYPTAERIRAPRGDFRLHRRRPRRKPADRL